MLKETIIRVSKPAHQEHLHFSNFINKNHEPDCQPAACPVHAHARFRAELYSYDVVPAARAVAAAVNA